MACCATFALLASFVLALWARGARLFGRSRPDGNDPLAWRLPCKPEASLNETEAG